jgi:tRNA modification GTPase
MAEPGEFARRAFLNNKLDLAQAEGLADLIDAETSAQHRQAIRQMEGETSKRIAALREQIITPLALLEAYIDFPDEEIPEEVLSETTERLAELKQAITKLLDDGGVGEKIRDGLEIVILGAPNAGKSSLLNALARREAAIVSPEAGTTRDLIEIHMDIGGYAATIIDTAGLREAEGSIEAEGIRRARARAANADLKLLVVDSVTLPQSMSEIRGLMDENTLLIATKSDLAPLPANLPFPAIAISTTLGAGMEHLLSALQSRISAQMDSIASPLITRARHREAMAEALSHLAHFSPTAPIELNCEELRLAASAIGKITGKIWVDDVLDLVFSRFCIGK